MAKREKLKTKNKPLIIYSFFFLIAIVLITAGFSSFSTNLSISALATIRATANIRVTNVTALTGTNGATTNYENYSVNSITSAVNLPNANSTMTYKIEVTNIGNVTEGIYDIDEIYKYINTNTNSNLEIKSQTVNLKETLCDDDISTKCKLSAKTSFNIEIGYKNNGYNANQTTHFIELDFDFRRTYPITYSGFSGNTSALPKDMIDGETKTIQFNNTSGIPSEVTVTGATGNYSSPNLQLSNVTIVNPNDSIVVTRAFTITYTGFSGNTSGLTNKVTSSGATITFTNTTGIPSKISVTGATATYNSPNLQLTNVTGDITVAWAYTVTYVDFTGSTSGLPDIIPSTGGTIEFNNTSGIPSSVTVTGATSNYNTPPNLVLTNVTGNVTITGVFNSNVQVINNGDGTTTTITETVVDNGDGSETTTTIAVNQDSNGDVLSSSTTTTTENSNGTATSTTINYDSEGTATTGSTSNTDVNGNVNTQEVEYDSNGNTTVTGYTIDTTDNTSGGEILNNTNIDTGLIVFDGKGFEMNMVFKLKSSENTGNAIFAAMQHTTGKKYSGFNLTVYKSVDWFIYAGSNSNLNESTGVFGSQVNGSRPFKISTANSTKTTQYTIKVRYLPANYGTNTINAGQIYVELSPIQTGSNYATSPYTKNSTYIPASLDSATFTLGGNGYTTAQNIVNFEVISFEIHKI